MMSIKTLMPLGHLELFMLHETLFLKQCPIAWYSHIAKEGTWLTTNKMIPLMSSMSLVLADFGLICASSKGSGESVHRHELDWAFIALKCDKYQISRFFPSFNASSLKVGETAHRNKLDWAFFAAWKCDKYQISSFFSSHLASKLLYAGKRLCEAVHLHRLVSDPSLLDWLNSSHLVLGIFSLRNGNSIPAMVILNYLSN